MQKKIGKIVNTQGIKGEIRVLSNSDFKHIRFVKGNKLTVQMKNDSKIIEIENHYSHKNFDILKLKGYDNINDVLKFKGCLLLGEKLTEDVLDEGEYFIEQIIGLRAIDENDQEIGTIKDVKTNTYQKMLIIETSKKNHMVPYVPEFVKEIDISARTLKIKLIPGLIDEN